jgi:hypothetical protein
VTPLHHIGEFFRNLTLAIPLGVVRLLFVGLLVALLIWVLRLPKSETTPPGGSDKPTENLKLWAGLAISAQIVIYSLV